jgi:hypothetical protein
MSRILTGASLSIALVACTLLPRVASAQEGAIAGTVRDSSDAVLPGVMVEVASPELIERTRSTTTDGTGQYRITNLPVGRYTVTFALEGFSKLERDDIELTTGFTANVTVVMSVGRRDETVVVRAATPVVDVQNARQATTFSGERGSTTRSSGTRARISSATTTTR